MVTVAIGCSAPREDASLPTAAGVADRRFVRLPAAEAPRFAAGMPGADERRVESPAASASAEPATELRVCADPNNMPFSNDRGEGFENRLAEMVAEHLGREVRYTWWPQRRGFVRNTLNARACDVVMGVPTSYELARTTRPYYRSTYVFVTRRGERITSFDDPALRVRRIGLHAVGDDYSSVPPAHALARRGIIDNIRGYSIYGDYSQPDPPADLVAGVARREIDVAIAWGPLAGYFAARQPARLEVRAVPAGEGSAQFVFPISMAVRRDDDALHASLNRFIERRGPEIARLLREYRVPLVERGGQP